MVENITLPKNPIDIYIDTLLEVSRAQRQLVERMQAQQLGECFSEIDSEGILLPKAA